jgi:peptidoglycan-associated lipoprotein
MRTKLWASAATLLLSTALTYANDEEQAKPEASTGDAAKTEARDVELYFELDSADLDQTASSDLQQLADWAKCDSTNAIILEGHADPTGTREHNLELSAERAAVVRDRLIDMGVPSKRIVVTIFGENGTPRDTHAAERRVTARAAGTPVEPSDIAEG